ncbi:MAG TPA: hypothetical protein PLC42_02660, partial [Parachlamydiaceae bacterium]|nr:hypothetical protein [Parachlamydiaceae bacterium]
MTSEELETIVNNPVKVY